MNFLESYNRLNPDQKRAVDTIEGPVLVIAGPGTGKTQILSLRIANILKNTDMNPSSILCLTFTEAGVLTMKNRLAQIIGSEAFKVNIHTFHSFCSEIIKTFPQEFNFNNNVETIKDIDKLAIFKEILIEKKLTSLQQRNDILGNFKSIVNAISTLKKEFIEPNNLFKLIKEYELNLDPKKLKMETSKIRKMYDLQIFYEAYLEKMQERDLIDFDDMIFKVTKAFSTNDDLVKFFQEQYLYTLVDEFQDTNNSQLEVIKSISSFGPDLQANVFAVGDDDQTIFRFQGAKSENFEKFLEIFPNTEVVILHTNYRSKQDIIDVSTNVIENNKNRIEDSTFLSDKELNKHFTAFNKEPGITEVHEFEHSFHEDYWIAEKILELLKNGEKSNEIAVITRTNKQITNISKIFDKLKIGYSIKRSESIIEDKDIKNILKIFGLLSHPEYLKDDNNLWEVLAIDFIGLNSFDIFSLYWDAKKNKMGMFDYITITHLPKYEKIYKFINAIIGLQQYAKNNNVAHTFTKFIQTIDVIKFFEAKEDAYAKLNKLSSLYQYINTRSRFISTYNLETFLTEIKLMQDKNILLPIDPIDVNIENKINILTAHSAKGMEFKNVFIYQCSEKRWEKNQGGRDAVVIPPLVQENKIDEKEETLIEERRLFYVAMTRAKEKLFLTYSRRYYDSDSGEVDTEEKNKSLFILESKISNETSHPELIQKHQEITKILLEDLNEPIIVPENNKAQLQSIVNRNLSMSASKLKKYEACHYKFMLEDIFKIPTPKSLNLEIGTAVHKGIEYLTKTVHEEKGKIIYASLDQVYTQAIQELEKNLSSDTQELEDLGSIDVAYEEIKRALEAYYKYFEQNIHKPIETEFMVMGYFEEIRLNGRIDKISEEDSAFILTDYKTTSKPLSITEFLGLTKNSDKAHLRQLMFYRLLLENSLNFKSKNYAKNISKFRIEYIDTKLGEIKVYEIPTSGILEYKPRANSKSTAEFDLDQEYISFKEDLKSCYQQIKELNFNRTTDLRICQFCAFKRHCGR